MGRPRLLVHDVAAALALAAMFAAPLRVASGDDGPTAEPPAPAPTTAEPPAPAPEPPAKTPEQTPEERAKELGWDEETTETPAEPKTAEPSEENEDEEDDDDDDDGPDIDDVIEADPVLAKDYKKARTMAIAGGSTAAVGIAFAASGIYLVAAESLSTNSMGRLSDNSRLIGGWVTMSIGLAALTAGVIVMALGLTKRKRVLTEAEARMPPTAFVSPWVGKRSGGMGLSLRF